MGVERSPTREGTQDQSQASNPQPQRSTQPLVMLHEDDPPGINSMKAVKLPQPFWRDNPARYFTVAEMTFALHRITSDESKYRYVIIHLDPDLLNIVGDIIDRPPEVNKYETLKARIIDCLSESQETRLRRLLRGQAMGDEKPSVFLQRLRNLAGGQCNDNVLRSLFMEQMPENMRGILAISQLDDLAQLAAQADRIAEVMRPQIASVCPAVGEVTLYSPKHANTNTNSTVATTSATQTSEIGELRRAIEELTHKFERSFRGRSRSRGRYPARSRSGTPNRKNSSGPCYYHRKFGTEARNCKPPCSWEKQLDKKEN